MKRSLISITHYPSRIGFEGTAGEYAVGIRVQVLKQEVRAEVFSDKYGAVDAEALADAMVRLANAVLDLSGKIDAMPSFERADAERVMDIACHALHASRNGERPAIRFAKEGRRYVGRPVCNETLTEDEDLADIDNR